MSRIYIPLAKELEVVFTTLKDCPTQLVKEFCVMPSGDIVVMTVDNGAGSDSLWFDRNGQHPKSYLRLREKFSAGMVRCDLCNYEWSAVRPLSAEQLECPNCKNLTMINNI